MKFIKKLIALVNKILFLWIISASLIILTFFLIYYKITPHESQVALHYNIVTGVDLLGSKTSLYKIPITGAFVFLVNLSLSKIVKSDHDFIFFMAGCVSLLVSMSLMLAVLFLLKVN